MTGGKLLFRARLGFPWGTALLVLACVLTTLPLFFSHDLYLVLGTGDETRERPTLAWWHPVVAKFVHGGGWPGTAAHLIINCTFFIFLGSLTERLLGSGRFFLVTFAGLVVSIVLTEIIAGGRGHGASGMTWSYLLFTGQVLVHLWRTEKRRSLKDPGALFLALLFVLQLIGLVNHWHRYNLAASIPFFLWWRRVLGDNLDRVEQGRPLDRWRPSLNRLGILGAALLCLFTASLTLAAVLGLVR